MRCLCKEKYYDMLKNVSEYTSTKYIKYVCYLAATSFCVSSAPQYRTLPPSETARLAITAIGSEFVFENMVQASANRRYGSLSRTIRDISCVLMYDNDANVK